MGWIKVTLPRLPGDLTPIYQKKNLVSFIIFEILFYVAASTKNIFV